MYPIRLSTADHQGEVGAYTFSLYTLAKLCCSALFRFYCIELLAVSLVIVKLLRPFIIRNRLCCFVWTRLWAVWCNHAYSLKVLMVPSLCKMSHRKEASSHHNLALTGDKHIKAKSPQTSQGWTNYLSLCHQDFLSPSCLLFHTCKHHFLMRRLRLLVCHHRFIVCHLHFNTCRLVVRSVMFLLEYGILIVAV